MGWWTIREWTYVLSRMRFTECLSCEVSGNSTIQLPGGSAVATQTPLPRLGTARFESRKGPRSPGGSSNNQNNTDTLVSRQVENPSCACVVRHIPYV